MSTLNPCVEVVRIADKVEDKEPLETIDKVICLDTVYTNEDVSGESLYWNFNVTRKSYTREEYQAYLKAFLKLSIKYPATIIQERLNMIINTSGMMGLSNCYHTTYTLNLFRQEGIQAYVILQAFHELEVKNDPIFINARETLIRILGCQNERGTIGKIYGVIWNPYIPILIMLIGWGISLSKRKLNVFAVLTVILLRVPIIILTQPAAMFMYYLPFYLVGYVCLIYGLQVKGIKLNV